MSSKRNFYFGEFGTFYFGADSIDWLWLFIPVETFGGISICSNMSELEIGFRTLNGIPDTSLQEYLNALPNLNLNLNPEYDLERNRWWYFINVRGFDIELFSKNCDAESKTLAQDIITLYDSTNNLIAEYKNSKGIN